MIANLYVFDPDVDKLPVVSYPIRDNIKLLKKRTRIRHFFDLYYHIMSLFTYYRYSIVDSITGKELAYTHASIKGLFQMRFLQKMGGGIYVGPDATIPDERGKGLHPYLLNNLLKSLLFEGKRIFIYAKVDNISSIKGIEKSGFRHCGYITKYNHMYYLTDKNGKCI